MDLSGSTSATIFLMLLAANPALQLVAAQQDYGMLLDNYLASLKPSSFVFPSKNVSKVIRAEIGFFLGQLLSLDGARQTMKVSGYLLVGWDDERMVWNSSDFGGAIFHSIGVDQLWYPKLILYNGVGSDQIIVPDYLINLRSVSPNLTKCSYVVRRDFEVACPQDMSKFPNDVHECSIDFLLYDDGRLLGHVVGASRLNSENTNFFILGTDSNEWNMLEFTQYPIVKLYEVEKNRPKYPNQIYTVKFKFRREYHYYMNNVIIPLILLTGLQVLVFFVPIESGEKMSLGITILLSFTVFLLLLDGIIPKSKTIPSIAYFITGAMTIASASLTLTSLILRFYYVEEGKPMPKWMRKILLKGLATVMLIKVPTSATLKSNSVVAFDEDLKTSEESKDSEQQVENPWKVGALALERLMVFIGILMVVAITCVYLIPPFLP